MNNNVVLAFLHPGEVSASFLRSMMAFQQWDLLHNRRLRGYAIEECGAGRIIEGRNSAARKFLELDVDADWLLFVDADMGFDPDAVDRLIDSADPESRPVVGGLCFAQRKGPDGPAMTRALTPIPTVYRWVDAPGQAGFAPIVDYPRDSIVECDGTGAAFLLIHKTVLQALAEVFPSPRVWFDDTVYKGQVFGEDLTFCRRVAEAGFPLHVNTSVKVSHYKTCYLDESTVGDLTAVPNFVVIPTKGGGRPVPLVHDLLDDDVTRIFVMDNGLPKHSREALEGLERVEVVDCRSHDSIHTMWNLGLELASRRAWQANVAVLNDDLTVSPWMISKLASALRSDALLGAVSPNYDGRAGDGKVEYVTELCAGRYDGTGGLAGFAFMFRGETGYRFPEDLKWWYGDNDLLLSILYVGSRAGIVLDAACEHQDGATGDWESEEMQPILAADKQAFEAKWKPVLEAAA